jgi:AcrR family transcriptional regulator
MLPVSIYSDIDDVNIVQKKMNTTRSTNIRPYHHGDLRHALIDAAMALVTEEQDWTFSLREVARRAGVSHNAPYNHFGEKQDLLIAVAGAGFERLRERMAAAVAGIAAADKALLACGRAYLATALESPALYRLMLGPALAKSKGAGRRRRATPATMPGLCWSTLSFAVRARAYSPSRRTIQWIWREPYSLPGPSCTAWRWRCLTDFCKWS